MKKRTKYIIAFFLLLFVEVIIAVYVHDSFIRPYGGDVLVVMVLYCLIRIWIPDCCRLLPLYIFLFAAGVELLQYCRLVQVLGVENNPFLRIVIGSVFDIKDIICYGVGCIILGIKEGSARRKH
ncbi:ribosomal maturation YjgA family protein [Anaerosporobacter faecicola]|uniref:ribosomal maturation YjgA family protein n=1 Tax=Anaerosporobacter faecicola TaxID=2718714 RepID=UPI00143B7A2B|nr:DUF2809 domain-containing protein [Anaerosporobacter faecicola]